MIPFKTRFFKFTTGAYPETFRGRGFEIPLYGREGLGGFWDFSLETP